MKMWTLPAFFQSARASSSLRIALDFLRAVGVVLLLRHPLEWLQSESSLAGSSVLPANLEVGP